MESFNFDTSSSSGSSSSKQLGFPRFIHDSYRRRFYHWFHVCNMHLCYLDHNCLDCNEIRKNIHFATKFFLKELLASHIKFTRYSDVCSLNTCYMSPKKAKEILALRHIDYSKKINNEFPCLNISFNAEELIYLPLLGVGFNSLYEVLKVAYNCLMYGSKGLNNISKASFCLLCFHINGQCLLSASTVRNFWGQTLAKDNILILLSNFELEEVFYKLLTITS